MGKSRLKWLEAALLLTGAIMVSFAALSWAGGRIYSRIAVAKFQSAASARTPAVTRALNAEMPVDFSLWSPQRIRQYKAALAEPFDEPLALLRIAKLDLEVPVFEGVDERVLNRGAGRIPGTAGIGEAGNIGIAGHRDGYFRKLQDVAIGDTIMLNTITETRTYTVDSIEVVTPNDVSVLTGDETSALTLVTCFPFYFVGSAPQRYIVHAALTGQSRNAK